MDQKVVMNSNYILMVIHKIKEIYDDIDFLSDFDCVNKMVDGSTAVDIKKLDFIANKYEDKFNFIFGMERQANLNTNFYPIYNPDLEYAFRLRNGMIKIYVIRKYKDNLTDKIKSILINGTDFEFYNLIVS